MFTASQGAGRRLFHKNRRPSLAIVPCPLLPCQQALPCALAHAISVHFTSSSKVNKQGPPQYLRKQLFLSSGVSMLKNLLVRSQQEAGHRHPPHTAKGTHIPGHWHRFWNSPAIPVKFFYSSPPQKHKQAYTNTMWSKHQAAALMDITDALSNSSGPKLSDSQLLWSLSDNPHVILPNFPHEMSQNSK